MNFRSLGPSRSPLARELLAYAAALARGGPPPPISPLETRDDRELEWILDGGLGPMLHRGLRDTGATARARWREALHAADLTAQVWQGNRIETTCEVIDTCRALGVPVTLLKGISVSEQHYPAGHLRPMGDVDVLVPAPARAAVEAALVQRAYAPARGLEPWTVSNHGIPLRDPEREVWVEVHEALFENVDAEDVFGSAYLRARSMPSTFHGREVLRLPDELQLLYLAHAWAHDMAHYAVKVHPTCLPALFDAVFIVSRSPSSLDLGPLPYTSQTELAIASLHTMMSYLAERGVADVDRTSLAVLGSRQRVVGAVQRRMMHAAIDRYLVGARPWDRPWPLPIPGRYSIRRQLRKRLFGPHLRAATRS